MSAEDHSLPKMLVVLLEKCLVLPVLLFIALQIKRT